VWPCRASRRQFLGGFGFGTGDSMFRIPNPQPKALTSVCGGDVRDPSEWKQRRDQASRAISTARLKRSRALHLPPINLVVSQGPSGALRLGSVHLGEGFPLRCIQRLSPRDIANRRCPWQDSRDTRGRFVRVLSYYGRHPSTLQRPYRIQTELSHDVLNPAHVPL
jgi:hypothetical protein